MDLKQNKLNIISSNPLWAWGNKIVDKCECFVTFSNKAILFIKIKDGKNITKNN